MKSSTSSNTWGANKGYVLVILLILLALAVFEWIIVPVADWVKIATRSVPAPMGQEAEAMKYLQDHASAVPEVATMIGFWKTSPDDFPRVLITDMPGDLDAFHFWFCRDTIFISRHNWDYAGPGAVAFRAELMFAEFQHCGEGGHHPDNQATQETLIEVRRHFSPQDLQGPVPTVTHRGTTNHG
jgi:hypothetical protein